MAENVSYDLLSLISSSTYKIIRPPIRTIRPGSANRKRLRGAGHLATKLPRAREQLLRCRLYILVRNSSSTLGSMCGASICVASVDSRSKCVRTGQSLVSYISSAFRDDMDFATMSVHSLALMIAWNHGDQAALECLTPLVQGELHRLAKGYMAGERKGHLLQTTALVNEAYLRLRNPLRNPSRKFQTPFKT